MLNEKIQAAFNQQINEELFSAYLYYAMSAKLEDLGLAGCASWMRKQAMEEMGHAHRFYHFIVERGGQVQLKPIEAPQATWESAQAMFAAAYAHEQKITASINQLVDLAIELRDHASNNFLQWFVSEQVEEEVTASDILAKLKLVDATPSGLFIIDRELGSRPLPTFQGMLNNA